MTAAPGQWEDLTVRLMSGTVIAAIGLGTMWAGGLVFQLLCAGVAGIMVWELARMLQAGRMALGLAALSGAAILAAAFLPNALVLPLFLLPSIIGLGSLPSNRLTFAVFAGLILLAAFGLMELRGEFGFTWIVWLVLVVAVSDIFGYFAGRMIGGPKFWPRVSPKKTWAGTIAGWIGAGGVGALFMQFTNAGPEVIGVSIAAAMAGQMGDIAESAVKRHSGVKDSSSVIPGHGGLFDRFDALLGATVFLLIVEQFVAFPPSVP